MFRKVIIFDVLPMEAILKSGPALPLVLMAALGGDMSGRPMLPTDGGSEKAEEETMAAMRITAHIVR